MKWNLKSIITLLIVIVLSIAFTYVVLTKLDDDIAKSIVVSFLTIATSTVGFYIGYQTNKPSQNKMKEGDEDENL